MRLYESHFWYYSVVEIVFKMVLTGVLCVVAAGSALQVVVALCVCLVYAMFLLRQSPYFVDTADLLALATSMTLSATIFIAFIATVNTWRGAPFVSPTTLDLLL